MTQIQEGVVQIIPAMPHDPLCLRCGRYVPTDCGYVYEVFEGRTSYVMCWDCAPSEWQVEMVDYDATLPKDERALG